jgi:YNFM family putative membrane transporter
MAYLNEEFSSKDIGRVMGYYISGTAVGGLTGRIIIGPLTDLMNWHMAFFVQGIVCLLGSLWFIKYLPESRNFTKMDISMEQWISAIKKTLFNGRLFSLYITGFLLLGSFVAILNYIGYPLTRPPYNLSQTLFGFLFFVNLFGVWSSILFGKLADRYTRKYVMALAIVIIIAGALLTLNVHLIVKIIGVAAVAFGFMAGHSVASSWVGLMASREHKGQAASFYLLFYYTGSSLVGWSGGKILSHYGWNTLVYFVCVLLFASILVSCYPWSLMSKKSLLSLEPVSEGHTSGFE